MAISFSQICYIRNSKCPHLAIFARPVSTLIQSWNVKAPAVLQREQGPPPAPLPTVQPGAPLFAIRVCLLLAVLTQ